MKSDKKIKLNLQVRELSTDETAAAAGGNQLTIIYATSTPRPRPGVIGYTFTNTFLG